MTQPTDDKRTPRQRRNMRFAEERIELLDSIRDIIGDELDRRGMRPEGDPHPENPPPPGAGGTPPHPKPPDPAPCRTLWQRIVSLLAHRRT